MFSITSFAAVVAVAKTFGVAALDYAVANSTLSHDANQVILNCKQWAKNTVISVENSNDGNNEYSVDAIFSREALAGMYVTTLEDIAIVRCGFGSYRVSAREALQKCYINRDDLNKILFEIDERNEAALVLGI